MRRAPIVAAIVGLALAAGAWTAWTATARPTMVLEPTALDFGPLEVRTTREVIVRNAGRAPLRVLGVSSSCGCTIPSLAASSVAPGGAARLQVTFDPEAHGPETGPAQHSVYIRTNDPRTPEAEVEVRAVVIRRGAP